ncbi:acyltransferase family protein, partial [Georgenia sp. 10Sc9-8]|nr:acyltransferase family protein [Georgenia halotolerans]
MADPAPDRPASRRPSRDPANSDIPSTSAGPNASSAPDGTPPRSAPSASGDRAEKPRPPAPAGVAGGQDTAPARPRLYLIDGLRFVAAAAVMLYHYTALGYRHWGAEAGEAFPEFGPYTLYAAIAPELFFLISGFVILMTAWGRGVPHVIASRVSRLYPTYWFAVITTSILLVGVWRGAKEVDWGDALINVTMLQAAFGRPHIDGVYWTMWVELRFYVLIVIFVTWGITRRRILWVCLLWPLAAEAARLWATWPWASTILISGYAPLFAGGMLLYLLHRDGHRLVPWALLGMNVVLAMSHVVPNYTTVVADNTGFEASGTVLALVLLSCFVGVALVALTPLGRVQWRWLVPLGALTYPLYLLHEWWGWWFIAHVHQTLGRWPTLLLTCAIA